MTIHGFKVTLVAAMTVAACMFLTVPTATAAEGAFKLEGAWVAKVVGIPAQWSYVLVPDSSGRYAALEGSLDIGFSLGPLFPPSDKTSLLMANLVMTGPKTGKFNSVWYGIRARLRERCCGLAPARGLSPWWRRERSRRCTISRSMRLLRTATVTDSRILTRFRYT
jgi:hypothetical protein